MLVGFRLKKAKRVIKFCSNHAEIETKIYKSVYLCVFAIVSQLRQGGDMNAR
jgi:hypothetical protein